MNKFFLLSLLALSTLTSAFAQQVNYRDDIIYLDEQPYAIMKKSGGMMSDYSVRTLDNKEVMMVHFDKGDGGSLKYLATFTASGMQVFLKNDFGFGKKLAKEVVENNLIKNGALNPAGERRFLMSHSSAAGEVIVNDNPPPPAYKTTTYNSAQRTEGDDTYSYSSQNSNSSYQSAPTTYKTTTTYKSVQHYGDDSYGNNNSNQSSNSYTSYSSDDATVRPRTVDRDRGQNIYVAGDRIRQDNKLIGRYTKTISNADGESYSVFSFLLPDGSKVAEARIKQFNGDHFKLFTIYDNKVRMVSINPDTNIDFDQVREIARYLSEHSYL